jgi:Peptidase family M28
MKPLRPLLGLGLVAGLVFSLFSYSRPLLLVQIAKGTPGVVDILRARQTEVLQELETCYLARADREELTLLRKAGLSVSVLDRDSREKEYFLVPVLSSGGQQALSRLGHVLPVEPKLQLFWTDEGDPLALLPPGIEKKPLPRSSILRFLRTSRQPETGAIGLRANDVIASIVSQVSRANLRSYVQGLQSFETRYTSTPNCELAGQFILNYFQSLGLEAWFEPFTFGAGTSTRNVIAELRGETEPDEIVIICGHYDSTSGEATVLAPGADDNASGVAAVMEAARVLAGHPHDFTVRFIAFSAEEWGLYGSGAYAAEARSSSERIIGVINLDMIAYAEDASEDLDVIVNDISRWLAERVGQVAAAYTGLAVRKIVDSSFVYSDHSPFWDQGYSAFCGIEDADVANPYYHTTADTVDTLNFDFFEDAVQTALAALSDLAQPIRSGYPLTPANLTADSTSYASAFTAIKNVNLTWQAVSDAAGYNIYRSDYPHSGFVQITSSPVQGTGFTDRALAAGNAYYYVVTSVWAGGAESNFSRVVESPPEPTRYEQSAADTEFSPFVWRWQ